MGSIGIFHQIHDVQIRLTFLVLEKKENEAGFKFKFQIFI